MKSMRVAADKPTDRAARWPVLLGAALAMGLSLGSPAGAQNGDAEKLLKGMADYVTAQKTLSVTYDSDIEVITNNLQKIQFSSCHRLPLGRPRKHGGRCAAAS